LLLWELPEGRAQSASAGGRILLLGVQSRGRPHERASRAVAQRLERMGEAPLSPRRPLSAAERRCKTPECMTALASQTGAGRLLGGEIVGSGRRGYLLTLWLFDAGTRRLQEEEGSCE